MFFYSKISFLSFRVGNILEIGDTKEILLKYPASQFKKVIDAKGMCILPGEYEIKISKLFLNI